jgi:hypothetical protein
MADKVEMKKYEVDIGANTWRPVWCVKSEVDEAGSKMRGGLVQTYLDNAGKRPYMEVHSRSIRTPK